MATEHLELQEVRIDIPAAYPGAWTPLHEAVRSGKVDKVKYLVENGADVHIKGPWGRTLMHEAAISGNIDTVRYLGDKGVDVNTKDNRGWTPLLVAATSGNVDMMRCLVDKGADINITAVNRGTPLHVAARCGNVDTVRYLVDKGADVNIASCGRVPLSMAVESGSANTVGYLVEMGADVNVFEIKRVPKYMAVEISSADTVGYLADSNVFLVKSKWTPLHEAAKRGNYDVVRCLVEKGADVNIKWEEDGTTPLHWACGGGNTEIVKHLLEKKADPTITANNGGNSLSWAIDSRHKDVALDLLAHNRWEELMKSSSKGVTIMRNLIAFMPDVAKVAFNRCVTTNEGKRDDLESEVHATSSTFNVVYNYEFLDDVQDKHSSDRAESWRPETFTKYTHPLYLIRKYDCSNLLKHPLVISLLELKWTRFGRYIFFGNLCIYLIFLTFLTAFGLVVLSPLERTCVDVLNGSFNGTAPENCEGLSIHDYRFLYVGAAVTILTALVRLATEIFQLCRHPLEYLLDWVNWLEIPLYLFSIMFTFVFATPCLCVYSWQWQIGVVAVFLGWVGLITFLQKWPVTGVYVLMFVNILGSFLKIAFLALLLVVAFALAFYMLLFEPDEMRTAFSHPGRAIVKVMAMTTGELDYDDLYHQQEGEDEIAFPPVSFLLWIIFLVLMPVLLSNLLVGLAVGDVDRLQKTASENRIGLQIDLILSFEELLESMGIRQQLVCKLKTRYPNVPATLLPVWCRSGTSDRDLIYCDDEERKLSKIQRKMAKWYSKLWFTDEYSTSGVKISDAIKSPPESIEKQLQKQRQQLEAKLQDQGDHQSQRLETKLKEQGEQLEVKLQEQGYQLEVKLQEQGEQLEAKLNKHSEKQSEQFQEAVRQLSECHKEQTEQLAGEVASLREALEKLITQMAAK